MKHDDDVFYVHDSNTILECKLNQLSGKKKIIIDNVPVLRIIDVPFKSTIIDTFPEVEVTNDRPRLICFVRICPNDFSIFEKLLNQGLRVHGTFGNEVAILPSSGTIIRIHSIQDYLTYKAYLL
jgi:hypothetical protein